ncbi:hypothetical protein CDD82_5388 [Ophiocordyceps australis]|uniref:Pierisin-like domain-containing protein n=1 Tax=Ophiocordyceps australis TaxID=1399860 RepID=A0A2C5Z0K1_9HYPO|nr:hypothetical protein CDD82_5388 [Ophiocordyceps australis]
MRLGRLILVSLVGGVYGIPTRERDASSSLLRRDKPDGRRESIPAEQASKEEVPDGSDVGIFFRGDSRAPEEVFRDGFRPQGTNMDLQQHLSFAGGSGYVSLSRSLAASRRYAFGRSADGNRQGYVYVVVPEQLPEGYYIPRLFPNDRAVQINREFAAAGAIPGGSIAGAYTYENGNADAPTGWLPNQAYGYSESRPYDPSRDWCFANICSLLGNAAQWVCGGNSDPCVQERNDAFERERAEAGQQGSNQPTSGANDPACDGQGCQEDDENRYLPGSNSLMALIAGCLFSIKGAGPKRSLDLAGPLVRRQDSCPASVKTWGAANGLDCSYSAKDKAQCSLSPNGPKEGQSSFTKLKIKAKLANSVRAGTDSIIYIRFGDKPLIQLFDRPSADDAVEHEVDVAKIFGSNQPAMAELQRFSLMQVVVPTINTVFGTADQWELESIGFEAQHSPSTVTLINDQHKAVNQWLGENAKDSDFPRPVWSAELKTEEWHAHVD